MSLCMCELCGSLSRMGWRVLELFSLYPHLKYSWASRPASFRTRSKAASMCSLSFSALANSAFLCSSKGVLLLRLNSLPCMSLEPSGEIVYVEPVFCYFESNVRQFMGRRREFVALEEEEEDTRL